MEQTPKKQNNIFSEISLQNIVSEKLEKVFKRHLTRTLFLIFNVYLTLIG